LNLVILSASNPGRAESLAHVEALMSRGIIIQRAEDFVAEFFVEGAGLVAEGVEIRAMSAAANGFGFHGGDKLRAELLAPREFIDPDHRNMKPAPTRFADRRSDDFSRTILA